MNKNYSKVLLLIVVVIVGMLSLSSHMNNEKLKDREAMRAIDCLDRLENTDSYYEAIFLAEEIRNYIATNATSWKKLRINESDLDEFVLNLQGPKAKRDLCVLENTNDYLLAVIRTQEIREAIAVNATSWEELKINGSDLDEFVLNLQGPKARSDLQFLKTSRVHDLACWNADDIRKAVAANATSWEELRINESDLDEFVLNAQERDAEDDLSHLYRIDRNDRLLSSILVGNIKKAVAVNATSWEKLKISESDLDELVSNE